MAEFVFVRIRNCTTAETLEHACDALRVVGVPQKSGLGTVEDAGAGWCVVRLRRGVKVEDVRGTLNRAGIGTWVDVIERVDTPIEGFAMARQLALCV